MGASGRITWVCKECCAVYRHNAYCQIFSHRSRRVSYSTENILKHKYIPTAVAFAAAVPNAMMMRVRISVYVEGNDIYHCIISSNTVSKGVGFRCQMHSPFVDILSVASSASEISRKLLLGISISISSTRTPIYLLEAPKTTLSFTITVTNSSQPSLVAWTREKTNTNTYESLDALHSMACEGRGLVTGMVEGECIYDYVSELFAHSSSTFREYTKNGDR